MPLELNLVSLASLVEGIDWRDTFEREKADTRSQKVSNAG